MALIDTHAALEDVLRRYLGSEHGLREAAEGGEYNFPALIRSLRECAGDKVIDWEMSEHLLNFNALRNRVVHEGYVPSRSQVQEGSEYATTVVRALLRASRRQSLGIPQEKTMGRRRGTAALTIIAALALSLGALYVVLPDVFPLNPIDDILVGGPCLLLGIVLVIIALAQRGD